MAKVYFDEDAQDYKGDNLYFIEDKVGGAIKIGRGNDARARLRSLQTGNPRPLALIAEIPDKGYQEAFWHCAWELIHYRGEWYHADEMLLSAIGAANAGEDWTDHVPPLIVFPDEREIDDGEWQEHMLDALDAYEEVALTSMKPTMALRKAAAAAIYDPDFDGRCILTRHAAAMAELERLKPELFQ